MELIDYDKDSVTIKFDNKTEFSKLLAIADTTSACYSLLDSERLMLSEEEVEKFTTDIFKIARASRETSSSA